MTVLVVALNPAWDITHRLAALVPGATNRVTALDVRAGGKALNVARTLQALGEPVRLVGLAGDDLAGAAPTALPGVRCTWVRHGPETRRTIALVTADEVTVVAEPGTPVDPPAWRGLCRAVAAALPSLARSTAGGPRPTVVLTGSVPPGPPDDAYAELVHLGHARGATVVLDTSGRALPPGVAAGPDLVTPNADELSALVGRPVAGLDATIEAAHEVRRLGAGGVVVTRGADGLVAVIGAETWVAHPPPVAAGNPTGAGDAVVASLVADARRCVPWSRRLRRAAALGAAVVAEPQAGSFDPERWSRLCHRTTVRRIEAA